MRLNHQQAQLEAFYIRGLCQHMHKVLGITIAATGPFQHTMSRTSTHNALYNLYYQSLIQCQTRHAARLAYFGYTLN